MEELFEILFLLTLCPKSVKLLSEYQGNPEKQKDFNQSHPIEEFMVIVKSIIIFSTPPMLSK
jgi:hypothetical protein